METTIEPTKPYRVLIRPPIGDRVLEFKRYARLADAEIDAKALRGHGIDAHAAGPATASPAAKARS